MVVTYGGGRFYRQELNDLAKQRRKTKRSKKENEFKNKID